MLPTPSTSHIDYNHIYEPAEDSFLLLDTLSSKSETDFLQGRFPIADPPLLVLEAGIGSGVVLAFATAHAKQIFGRSDVITLGTDVNPFACVGSQTTVEFAASESRHSQTEPGVFLGSLNGDLASAIQPGSIDILIFNPPYVPSEDIPSLPAGQDSEACQVSEDVFTSDSHLLSLSTDGGLDGMEITNRLLADLSSVLSGRGVAYILLCAPNKPDEVIASIKAWPTTTQDGHLSKWLVDKVSSSGKKAGWERLCVIRIWRERVLS